MCCLSNRRNQAYKSFTWKIINLPNTNIILSLGLEFKYNFHLR